MRYPFFAGVVFLLIISVLMPLILLVWQTLTLYPDDYSLKNLTFLFWIGKANTEFAEGEAGILRNMAIIKAAWNSVKLALTAAAAAGFLGIFIGYAVVRGRHTRLANTVEQVSFLPYLVPGIAFGALYLSLFTHKIGPIPALYGTFLLLALVCIAKNLPFTVRTGITAILQIGSELEGLAGRYPQEMSGGQQQRVALARMLVSKPDIFLMDEPLSNLDARLRLEMRAEIKNIHYQTGATTVYVTHDQVEGLTMANRITVLNQGKIEQLERPKTVYRRPATLFVSDFIGSPSMNKIEGKTLREQHERGIAVDCGLFTLRTCYKNIQAGREVFAAIRPENISVVLKTEANTLEADVKTVLPAGPETILQVGSGNLSGYP